MTKEELKSQIDALFAQFSLSPATDSAVVAALKAGNLTPAAQRQLAAQGGVLLEGQYVDVSYGCIYSPLTDEDRTAIAANGVITGWSCNTILGIKTQISQF